MQVKCVLDVKGIESLDTNPLNSMPFFVAILGCIRFFLQLVKRYCPVFLDYLLRKKVTKTAVETGTFLKGELYENRETRSTST